MFYPIDKFCYKCYSGFAWFGKLKVKRDNQVVVLSGCSGFPSDKPGINGKFRGDFLPGDEILEFETNPDRAVDPGNWLLFARE